MNKTTSIFPYTISSYTILGFILAVLGVPLVLITFRSIAPFPLTNSFVLIRESSFFLMAGLLFLIIFRGEKLDLQSIGLHNKHWGKSILWSFALISIFLIVVFLCLELFKSLGISFGKNDGKYANVSLWVITINMLRAGFVEEIVYRGYLMERLSKIYNHWIIVVLLPSLFFGACHFYSGAGAVIIAIVSGFVFSYCYWIKRDLKINIIAHTLIDLVPNVIVPLIAGDS